MIGVIHGDGAAEDLLGDWLESAGPGVVTLEFSPHGLDFRQSKGRALRRRTCEVVESLRGEGLPIDKDALDSLLAYIDLPREYTVASDYCRRRGRRLFLIDMDRFSARKLGRISDLLARENLVRLLSGPGWHEGHRQKALARLFFEKGIKTFSYTKEMRLRDRHMKLRISQLMRLYRPSLFAHICGWQHLSDPFGLYTALSPRKVFIHDQALRI